MGPYNGANLGALGVWKPWLLFKGHASNIRYVTLRRSVLPRSHNVWGLTQADGALKQLMELGRQCWAADCCTGCRWAIAGGASKNGVQRKKAKRQAANGYDNLKSGTDRLLGQAGRVRNGVLKKVRVHGLLPILLSMYESWLSDSAGASQQPGALHSQAQLPS